MQFVLNGPDIPDELLQAHEEGRVVFFCGAGISVGLGLPKFSDLVQKVRDKLGSVPDERELKLDKEERWDAALEYLERKLPLASNMRKVIAETLQIKVDATEQDYRTHLALLKLARTRGVHASTHLVTTNFDRAFENVKNVHSIEAHTYEAPFLPTPKDPCWDGVVYLHGLLPEKVDDSSDLRNIIITSGGFGRAYLLERWASRFVTELMRNYTLCFVGYSLGDPVMRYLIDAIEADREIGVDTNPVYMFVSETKPYNLVDERNESVKQIFYAEKEDHRLLHETLCRWAEVYEDGSQGKEAIIAKEALIDPDNCPDTGYIGRVVWALKDKSGIPAKRFAAMTPAPPISWLSVLEKYTRVVQRQGRLIELDNGYSDDSLIQRCLVSWLLRYLNHPTLILKCAKNPSCLNRCFKEFVSYKLAEYEEWIACEEREKIEKLKQESPFAFPEEFARKVWNLILDNRLVEDDRSRFGTGLEITKCLKSGYQEPYFLRKVANYIAPGIRIHETWSRVKSSVPDPKMNLDWEFASENGAIQGMASNICKSLPSDVVTLIKELERVICEGLEVATYLDEDAERDFRMICAIPSIADHFQNRDGVRTWRASVDMIRDAWNKLAERETKLAQSYYKRWLASPYLLFKRIALHCAKHAIIDPKDWLEEILKEDGCLLWGAFAKREICRLLAEAGNRLDSDDLSRLITAIIDGPPSSTGESFVKDAHYYSKIWLRLEKLREAKACLSKLAIDMIAQLEEGYNFKTNKWQYEEFSTWRSGTGCPDFEEERVPEKVPREKDELVVWLSDPKQCEKADRWGRLDNDFDVVVNENASLALDCLRQARLKGYVDRESICTALRNTRSGNAARLMSDFLLEECPKMPDEEFFDYEEDIANWAEDAAKNGAIDKNTLLMLATRIIDKPYSQDEDSPRCKDFGYVGAAINNAVGKIVTAILDFYFPDKIVKGCGVDYVWKELFTKICTDSRVRYRHGRVILASRCVALHYADEDWTREFLFPLFSWNRNEVDAAAVWSAFLWTTRTLVAPILTELRPDLESFLLHRSVLDEDVVDSYCTFVTAMGIIGVEGFDKGFYQKLFLDFNTKDLESAAKALVDIQRSYDENSEEGKDDRLSPEDHWEKRIFSFIFNVWPKDRKLLTSGISDGFVRLACYTRSKFEDAIEKLRQFLIPINEHSYCYYLLHEKGLAKRYPRVALELLSLIVGRVEYSGYEIRKVLDDVIAADVSLKDSNTYKQLDGLLRNKNS